MVTVMSPDGKPIQINASVLQAAGSQTNIGIYKNLSKMSRYIFNQNCQKVKRLVSKKILAVQNLASVFN